MRTIYHNIGSIQTMSDTSSLIEGKSIIVKDEEGNSVIKVSEAWSNQALINSSKYKKKYNLSVKATDSTGNSSTQEVNLEVTSKLTSLYNDKKDTGYIYSYTSSGGTSSDLSVVNRTAKNGSVSSISLAGLTKGLNSKITNLSNGGYAAVWISDKIYARICLIYTSDAADE